MNGSGADVCAESEEEVPDDDEDEDEGGDGVSVPETRRSREDASPPRSNTNTRPRRGSNNGARGQDVNAPREARRRVSSLASRGSLDDFDVPVPPGPASPAQRPTSGFTNTRLVALSEGNKDHVSTDLAEPPRNTSTSNDPPARPANNASQPGPAQHPWAKKYQHLSLVDAQTTLGMIMKQRLELTYKINGGLEEEQAVQDLGELNREQKWLEAWVRERRANGEVERGGVQEEQGEKYGGYGADAEEEEDDEDENGGGEDEAYGADDEEEYQIGQLNNPRRPSKTSQQPPKRPTKGSKAATKPTAQSASKATAPRRNSRGGSTKRRAKVNRNKMWAIDEVLHSDGEWLQVTFEPDSEGKSYKPEWVKKEDCTKATLRHWARKKAGRAQEE